jgi:hypothetical protein
MSSLWDAVFLQVLGYTSPLMLNPSGTPYTYRREKTFVLIVHGDDRRGFNHGLFSRPIGISRQEAALSDQGEMDPVSLFANFFRMQHWLSTETGSFLPAFDTVCCPE